MINVVAWLLLYFVVVVISEFFFELTNVLSSERELKPAAVVWFVLLGLIVGLATGGLLPDRILPAGPFSGVSVLILPIALAGGMAIVGAARGTARSHLASWYGG